MIDYITGGEYLNVVSNKGAQPYINMSGNQPMLGAMTYDYNSQSMKVYDGSNWLSVGGGGATVNLSGQAISILKWAEQKMREEQELKVLAEKSPAVRDLLNQIKEKEEQIKMVQILMKEEEKV
jgi:TusA-related sulfurtransferase